MYLMYLIHACKKMHVKCINSYASNTLNTLIRMHEFLNYMNSHTSNTLNTLSCIYRIHESLQILVHASAGHQKINFWYHLVKSTPNPCTRVSQTPKILFLGPHR